MDRPADLSRASGLLVAHCGCGVSVPEFGTWKGVASVLCGAGAGGRGAGCATVSKAACGRGAGAPGSEAPGAGPAGRGLRGAGLRRGGAAAAAAARAGPGGASRGSGSRGRCSEAGPAGRRAGRGPRPPCRDVTRAGGQRERRRRAAAGENDENPPSPRLSPALCDRLRGLRERQHVPGLRAGPPPSVRVPVRPGHHLGHRGGGRGGGGRPDHAASDAHPAGAAAVHQGQGEEGPGGPALPLPAGDPRPVRADVRLHHPGGRGRVLRAPLPLGRPLRALLLLPADPGVARAPAGASRQEPHGPAAGGPGAVPDARAGHHRHRVAGADGAARRQAGLRLRAHGLRDGPHLRHGTAGGRPGAGPLHAVRQVQEVEAERGLPPRHRRPLRAHLGGLDDHVPLRQRRAAAGRCLGRPHLGHHAGGQRLGLCHLPRHPRDPLRHPARPAGQHPQLLRHVAAEDAGDGVRGGRAAAAHVHGEQGLLHGRAQRSSPDCRVPQRQLGEQTQRAVQKQRVPAHRDGRRAQRRDHSHRSAKLHWKTPLVKGPRCRE